MTDQPVDRDDRSVLPWGDAPYSIKRHGVSITNCDSEPVQTPGCIQDHGALVVFRLGELTIVQASENAFTWLGHTAEGLLGQGVEIVLKEGGTKRLRECLRREPVDRNPIYLFTLPARNELPPLDVVVHTIDDVGVLEFEATGRSIDDEPDYYALVKRTVVRLRQADTLRGFCELVSEEVRELTGFDRAMIYRFHPDMHGEVFAESRRAGLAPWLGLHYPAADIPKAARDIFMRLWVRPTPDVGSPVHELLPLSSPDTDRPLNMTYCALRGASVMYTEYLKNMQVTAGLTMPIRRGETLWGLIACHHYSGPRDVTYQVRAACEFLAQVVSLQHRHAEDREQRSYRLRLEGVHQQLIARAAFEGGLTALTDGRPTMVHGMDAGGAAIFHDDRWWTVGRTPDDRQLDALGEWLTGQPSFQSVTQPIFVTDSLPAAYAPAEGYANVACGILALPLARKGNNMMIWFRPETIQTVNWGGNPLDKPTVPGPHGFRLTPRASFELFVETVRGRSLPWKGVEVEAAARLRQLLMELVVARAEQLASLSADLANSSDEMDALAYVASHDLKDPLRGIHSYAHQLLDDAAQNDAEHRRKLEALVRLTTRMDSLLDSLLHFSRVGRTTLELESIDLNEVLAEAMALVPDHLTASDARITTPRPLPTTVSDRAQVREVLLNLITNALQYNTSEVKAVEVGFRAPDEAPRFENAPPGTEADTIFFVRDNGIGIEPKHTDHVFAMFRRLHGHDEFDGGAGAGLTIVKRLIARHGGQVWLTSTPGAGSTFYFTLPAADRDGM